MGESYGTIRAAVVAKMLMGGPVAASGRMNATTLNGVILLGQAMDFSNAVSADRRTAIAFPTYAATAWYHNKVNRAGRTVEKFFEEAQAFALGDYFSAISKPSLSSEERSRIAERMSQFVGIAPSTLVAADLRLSSRLFQDSVLRVEKLQVGAYDGRYTLPLAGSGGDPVSDDPAMGQYVPGFVAVGSEYFRNELKADYGVPYVAIEWATVNRVWDWGRGGGPSGRGGRAGSPADSAQAGRDSTASTAEGRAGGRGGRGAAGRDQNFTNDLATAMRRNPDLRLFVGTGYYDLVTTIGSAQETIARSPIDRQRVTFRNYESGHMPYLGPENRRKLAADVRQFIASASKPRGSVTP
jgi:carboxypeptidase C (cathepsin A)